MARVDEPVPSKDERGLIAVQRNPDSPLDIQRVYVDRQQAVQVPLEPSQQHFGAETKRQALETSALQQSDAVRSGPAR